jgi:hypothetical protein
MITPNLVRDSRLRSPTLIESNSNHPRTSFVTPLVVMSVSSIVSTSFRKSENAWEKTIPRLTISSLVPLVSSVATEFRIVEESTITLMLMSPSSDRLLRSSS